MQQKCNFHLSPLQALRWKVGHSGEGDESALQADVLCLCFQQGQTRMLARVQ